MFKVSRGAKYLHPRKKAHLIWLHLQLSTFIKAPDLRPSNADLSIITFLHHAFVLKSIVFLGLKGMFF